MTTATPFAGEAGYVSPDQLCVGLYVYVDLPWTDHPFTFSSFKIKSSDQIATLRKLGLERIRYSAERSDKKPLEAQSNRGPSVAVAAPASSKAALNDATDAAVLEKRARLEKLAAQRARIQACEGALLSTARTFKAINQSLFVRPQQSAQQAEALINSLADSMLVESDIAIHVMADKLGGEDVYDHSLNVVVLSMMLARELKFSPQAMRHLGMAALFHDVGEYDLPERVRRRGADLSKTELSAKQVHCDAGAQRAKTLGLAPEVIQAVAQHHENADGSGYPKRTRGAQISPMARVVCIADAFDSLCNPFQANKACTPHEALQIMYGQQRARYDVVTMNMFIRCMGIYPPGTVVVLSNGAVGLVTSVNSSRPLKPTVLVYERFTPKDSALVVDLEQEPDILVSKTMRPQELSEDIRSYLNPRKRLTYFFDSKPASQMR